MNNPRSNPQSNPQSKSPASSNTIPNAQALAQQLMQTLQQDKIDLATLLQCLEDERKVLESSNHDKLPSYTEQKARLTEQLDQRYAQRLQALKSLQTPIDAKSWLNLIEQLQSTTKLPLVALWNQGEEQLKQCQQLLLINEKIVAGLQNNVTQLMNALRGATGSGQTYSASGKAQVFSDNQTITSA